jgi:hypothetical protein
VGGVGLVGVGVGIGFGVDFADAQATVERDCNDNKCISTYTEADARALQARWNRSLALTIVGSTIGAAGLGMAIYGIVTAPKAGATAFVPWFAPGGGGAVVTGSF